MSRVIFSVPDVHCDHCVGSIEGAVGALDGVDSGVTVGLGDRIVDVIYDDSRLDRSEIVTVVEQQGYEVAT